MISTTDTIVAIATPRGRGALGMVRLSGGDSIRIVSALTDRTRAFSPRYATLCRVRGIDEVVVTVFRSPASFTGEDVAEITAHGSQVVLDAIVSGAVGHGARLAMPGEFTLRAVLHGRRDLVQAEAVADLIDASTSLQARTAFDQLDGTLTARITGIERVLFDLQARLEASLDFPEEGYRFVEARQVEAELNHALAEVNALLLDGRTGRVVREGATVVLAGRTNAGKSSIFNRLLGRNRAIVAATAGTTRDFVTEQINLDGIAVTLVDTAGMGVAGDVVEAEGMARAVAAHAAADVLLVVVDGSAPVGDDDRALLGDAVGRRHLVVWNKQDLGWSGGMTGGGVAVSALTGLGVDVLRGRLVELLCGGESPRQAPALSNIRHITLLDGVAGLLERAVGASARAAPEEFVLSEISAARGLLEDVTGVRGSEAVLEEIFSKFCVGK